MELRKKELFKSLKAYNKIRKEEEKSQIFKKRIPTPRHQIKEEPHFFITEEGSDDLPHYIKQMET